MLNSRAGWSLVQLARHARSAGSPAADSQKQHILQIHTLIKHVLISSSPPQIDTLRVYVDGSYRPLASQDQAPMSAGIWATAGDDTVSTAFNLKREAPSSVCAEYGAMFAALDIIGRTRGNKSSAFGLELQGLSQRAKCVYIINDNQRCVQILTGQAKLKSNNRDRKLIEAIQQVLSSHAHPVQLICASKSKSEHGAGILQSHRLAYKCTRSQPQLRLPM